MTELLAYPEWTEINQKNGLDPLGMQNSSVNLYQRLVPGIGNVTLRMRYYAFYAWLTARYAREIGNTSSENWRRFVRRGEALYALIAQHRGDEGGMAGVQWAQRALAAGNDVIDFAAASDPDGPEKPYLRQKWGVYGLAYASQLYAIGLYAETEEHDIPVPSNQWGDSIARAFGVAVGGSGEQFFQILQRGSVSRTELSSLANMVPSAISEFSDERRLFEGLLFANGALQGNDEMSRRLTLLLLLHAADHLDQHRNVTNVRWLFYAGKGADGKAFEVPEKLKVQQRRWFVYQANDLLHFAYETLLKYALDTLDGTLNGLQLDMLLAELVSELPIPEETAQHSWAEFLAATPPSSNANDSVDYSAERSLTEQIMKRAGPNSRIGSDEAWAAIRLLAVLINRTSDAAEAITAEFAGLPGEGFHSLLTERRFLATLRDEPLPRAIARLIEQRVIQRHLWVAYRKFRYQNDYTFLIEADDGRVRCRAKSGPVLTNPRLGPAITFLEDIHLIDGNGLTTRGKELLEAA